MDSAAQIDERRAELFAKLDRMGEAAAKADLASEIAWIDSDEVRWVNEWLLLKELARIAERERQAARSVAAAERSAAASEKSARFAMWSAIIALVTVGAGVLGALLTWLMRV